jgi:amino-acid N-acetyltransferase
MLNIRPATADDQPIIRKMVMDARLDPTSLKWRNFLIAEVDGDIAGIGQVKPYPGCEELGSLVVKREYRKQGIAAQIITALEARAGRPLYLLCVSPMDAYYRRFDYQTITWFAAPWFLKLKLLPALPFRLLGMKVRVMRKHAR